MADTNCRVNYYSADKGKQNMPGYMNKHSVPSKYFIVAGGWTIISKSFNKQQYVSETFKINIKL